MKQCVMAAVLGFALGMYVGYENESELEDLCRKTRKTKRKTMKQVHKAYDNLCDCMDFD